MDDVVSLFIKMNAGEATPDELEKVIQWAEHSPEKLDYLEQLSTLWEDVGKVTPNPELFQEQTETPLSNSWLNKWSNKWLKYWTNKEYVEDWGLGKIAFSASVFICAIAFLIVGNVSNQLNIEKNYSTQAGIIQDVLLTDGSALHLNGLSGVQVDFTEDKRQISMEQGEVYFEVAHDAQRAMPPAHIWRT